MGNNCVSNLIGSSTVMKMKNTNSMESTQGLYLVQDFCSTSEFVLHWTIFCLCCCALAFIIGICYSWYRFDGGEIIFEFKPYLQKNKKKEQNDIV